MAAFFLGASRRRVPFTWCIADPQVKKLKELRRKYTQEAAAVKTGISISTAKPIEDSENEPSQSPAIGEPAATRSARSGRQRSRHCKERSH